MKTKHSEVITSNKNTCVQVAFKNACSWLDETNIMAVGRINRFYGSGGTTTGLIPKYMDYLGIQYENTYDRFTSEKPLTVHRFAKMHSNGVYLILVSGHAFLLNHGKVFDPNMRNYGIQRRVIRAFKLLNADLEKEDDSWDQDTKFVVGVMATKRTGLGFRKGSKHFILVLKLFDRMEGFSFREVSTDLGMTMESWTYFIERGIIRKKETNS